MLWNTEDPEWWAIVKKYLQQIAAEHEEKIYPHDVAMLKYYPGPGMGLHSDQDGPCKGKCSYTSTIHLNIDYRGGSISFPRIDKVIKPPAGSAMFFPQVGEEWDHAISTLDSGERYVIITCWSKHEDMLRPQHSDFYTSS
jgi:hypothetical protein